MEKDLKFYHKQGTIYAIVSLALMLLAMSPLFFYSGKAASVFFIENKTTITTIQIIIAFLAMIGYGLSVYNRNKCEAIVRKVKEENRKSEAESVLLLIETGMTDQAADAFREYEKKYH